jgi:glycosyltransferase involved in cell wall biosynthesis
MSRVSWNLGDDPWRILCGGTGRIGVGGGVGVGVSAQRVDELRQLLVALDAAEGLFGVEHARGGPAQRHLSIAPAGNVAVGGPRERDHRRDPGPPRHVARQWLPKVNALRYYASLYFHGHSVGGTNPSLLEAMACGCTIAAHNNPFDAAVLENAPCYFSSAEDVTRILEDDRRAVFAPTWKAENLMRIGELYRWDKIITAYMNIFNGKDVPNV